MNVFAGSGRARGCSGTWAGRSRDRSGGRCGCRPRRGLWVAVAALAAGETLAVSFDAAAQASPTSSAALAVEDQEPSTLVSLRISAGLGGGPSDILAARLGGDLDLWLSEHWAVGLAAVANVQTYRAEEARSYFLLGPALALRGAPRGSHAFGSLALGVVNWSCAPGPCEDEGENGRVAAGAALAGGYVAHFGAAGIGLQVAAEWAQPHASGEAQNLSLTLDVVLGVAITR